MKNKNRTKERLTTVQLKHWVRAVQNGEEPSIKDPETKQISSLRVPFTIADGDGLAFTLSRAGTASWILRYRYGGRARELTIGNFPDIGLAEAREKARAKRAEIDQGGDPAADKRKAAMIASQDWTVRELAEDYRKKVLIGLGKSTQRSYERNLKRIENRLGAMLVSSVTSGEIVWLIEEVQRPWVESNMLLCTAKMLFRHAAGKRLIPANPCVGIELTALMGKRPPVRRRLMLSNDELRVLLNANMSAENLLAVKVLLGTAVRSDELRNAQWEQVDLKKGVWTVPTTKTGRGMQVPLSRPVKAWLTSLKKLSGNSKFVLPARAVGRHERNGGDAPINPNTLGAAIEFWLNVHKPDISRFTPHDLRSTAKSHMRALGVPREITEMCLNHKLPGVEGIYDVHSYFDERREALERWGEHLMRLEKAGLTATNSLQAAA
ncbi:site-specific integrase [Herbaspirillum sp. HC18]|nr:site-specific integrase [Herbaspirillum sp. HC18]